MQTGFSVGVRELKESGRYFRDSKGRSNARRKDGKFGKDQSTGSPIKPFIYRDEFNLDIGPYKLATLNFEVGLNGWSPRFAAHLHTPQNEIKRISINKSLSELSRQTEEYHPALISSLTKACNYIGCDKAIVREIIFEGASANLGVSLTHDAIGAKASAQVGALVFNIDTPRGEYIAKFKEGLGVGVMHGTTQTKQAKPGTSKTTSLSTGVLEISFTPKEDFTGPSDMIDPRQILPIANSGANMMNPQDMIDTQQKLPTSNSGRALVKQLTDQTVKEKVEKHPNNTKVSQLHEQYQKSSSQENPIKPYIQFERNFNQLIETGTQASFFLGQVASLTRNSDVARVATGISAVTQTIKGIHDLSQAFSVGSSIATLSSAGAVAAGTSSLASVSSFLGPAGMVLGGISLLSSLFSDDDDDDGLGEALAAIHSAVMEMWSEMRSSFEYTWQKLDEIQSSLNEMERNNWYRFKVMMTEMELLNKNIHYMIRKADIHHATQIYQIQHLETSLTNQLNELTRETLSYLEHLSDEGARKAIQNIFKSEHIEITYTLKNHTTDLFDWLTRTAALAGRSGDFTSELNDAITLKKLEEFFTENSRGKFNLPLGLFAKMAIQIAPELDAEFQGMTLINPQNWYELAKIYIGLIRQGKNKISESSDSVKQAYLNELTTLLKITSDTLRIIEIMALSPQLIANLITQYQASFNPLIAYFADFSNSKLNHEERSLLLKRIEHEVISKIRLKYLQLIAFYHLIDSNFSLLPPETTINIIYDYLKAINDLSEREPSFSAIQEKIIELLPRINSELWKEPFHAYLGTQFNHLDFYNRIQQSLKPNPLIERFSEIKIELESLINILDDDSYQVHQAHYHALAEELTQAEQEQAVLNEVIESLSDVLISNRRLSAVTIDAGTDILAQLCYLRDESLKNQIKIHEMNLDLDLLAEETSLVESYLTHSSASLYHTQANIPRALSASNSTNFSM